MDRLIPVSQKKLNDKQRTEKDMQQRGWGALSSPEKGERARSCSLCELSVNKACKSSHDKQKVKQYMTTEPPLQKILQRIMHTENESMQNHEMAGSTKPQEKNRQESRE
jgi:hypothetical protein